MDSVTLFVEGIADKKFITDYLSYLGIANISDNNFVIIKSNNEAAIQNRKVDFEKSTKKEKVNLLIFDADSKKQSTQQELERIKAKLNIQFETFLFPNNNDNGNLETLLERIINPKHQPIFDCFQEYQNCLPSKSPQYKVPATKTKVYAYVDTLLDKNNEKFAKEDYRDYLNTDHWNLDSPALNPLKEFLLEYLK